MLRSPGYGMLINHLSHEITELRRTGQSAIYRVKVLSRDGGYYQFRWQLRKAARPNGPAWMTTQVSPARQTGEQLSVLTAPAPAQASVVVTSMLPWVA